MAIIIGQKEQQAALKEIKAAYKEMESTNKFLEHQNGKGKYTVIFTTENGTRCSAVAHAESKEIIDRLVLHHKHLVSDRVVKLAEENRILLDLDEKLTFGLDLTPAEQEEFDAHMLAELEAAEQAAVEADEGTPPAEEELEPDNSPDKPFYAPDAVIE